MKAMNCLDLSYLCGLGLDETVSKRVHNFVTIFVDMDREERPVIFATPGKGKETLREFVLFLEEHGGNPQTVIEVICDMSPPFWSRLQKRFRMRPGPWTGFMSSNFLPTPWTKCAAPKLAQDTCTKGARWTTLKGLETERSEEQRAYFRNWRSDVSGNGFSNQRGASLGAGS